VLLAFTFIGTFSYGFYRLSSQRPGHDLQVAVIQGNIEQDKKWDYQHQQEVITTYEQLTFSAGTLNPALIVWPETAVPFVFNASTAADTALTEQIVSFQQTLNAYLLFGSILQKKQDSPVRAEGHLSQIPMNPVVRYSNSAVLLDRNGNISYIYDKIHLVPFGEYVPLRDILFFVDKLVYGVGDYVAGTSYLRAVTPFGSFSTPVCYEIIFPGLVRKYFAQGGDFIISITNDAWFGQTSGPYQHFSMAVFRAVENRKPVIRAANSGISGFIDSNGKILASTELFKRTTLTGSVRSDATRTLYTRFGDIFSYFCFICLVFLLLASVNTPKKERSSL
jgi:apolipoprotein N-acyltransferase